MALVNKPFSGSGLTTSSGRISVQSASIGTYYANGTIPTPDYVLNHATIKISESSSAKTYESTAFNGYNFSVKGGTTIEATIDGYIQADTVTPANISYTPLSAGNLYYLSLYAGSLRYQGAARLISFDGSIGVSDNTIASLKFQFYGIPYANHYKPLVQPS